LPLVPTAAPPIADQVTAGLGHLVHHHTSGRRGLKGSMQSYNYFCHLATQRLTNPASATDITFTPLPLFHNNALATGITATVLSGGRIAIAARFSLSNFWPEVHRSGATIVSLVGSIATLIAEAPDNEWSQRCFGQVHTVRGAVHRCRQGSLATPLARFTWARTTTVRQAALIRSAAGQGAPLPARRKAL
jgi:acyl-CoA synthetase (AMP-forming)/AMP-acid ligase II